MWRGLCGGAFGPRCEKGTRTKMRSRVSDRDSKSVHARPQSDNLLRKIDIIVRKRTTHIMACRSPPAEVHGYARDTASRPSHLKLDRVNTTERCLGVGPARILRTQASPVLPPSIDCDLDTSGPSFRRCESTFLSRLCRYQHASPKLRNTT